MAEKSPEARQEVVSKLAAARGLEDEGKWAQGDIALAIETTWRGRELQQIAEEAGVNYGTLLTYRWVSKVVPPEKRKLALSHLHHRYVAGNDDMDRWLNMAEDLHWTPSQLKAHIGLSELSAITDASGKRLRGKTPSPAAEEEAKRRALAEMGLDDDYALTKTWANLLKFIKDFRVVQGSDLFDLIEASGRGDIRTHDLVPVIREIRTFLDHFEELLTEET